MAEALLAIIGDSMIDKYVMPTRKHTFCLPEIVTTPGGAGNITANCWAMVSRESKVMVESAPYINQNQEYSWLRELDENKDVVVERSTQDDLNLSDSEKQSYYAPENKRRGNIVTPLNKYKDSLYKVLVLADYNKGVLNEYNLERIPFVPDVVVIDSRYRSLDPELLSDMDPGKTVRIWHATGDEYDLEWALKLGIHYVVHTNGPNPVELIALDHIRVETFEVPTDTVVKNSIGAGDTMTAAIASYLALNRPANGTSDYLYSSILEERLCAAIRYGILACQEVIQDPYTAVPLENIL